MAKEELQQEIHSILTRDPDCFGAVAAINQFLADHHAEPLLYETLVEGLADFEQELMELDLNDGNYTRLLHFNLILHDLARPDRDTDFIGQLMVAKLGDLMDDMLSSTYHAMVTTPKASRILDDLAEMISKYADHDTLTHVVMVDLFLEKLFKVGLDDTLPWTTKLQVLKALNLLADGAQENVITALRTSKEFELKLLLLAESIFSAGDYEIQVCTMEAMYRLGCDNRREEFARQWLKQGDLLEAFLAMRQENFETDARIFLNIVNGNSKTGIVTVPCCTVHLGRYVVQKPPDDDYTEFWVDFNLASHRVTLFCAQEPSTDSNQQVEDLLWDTIAINTDSVTGFTTVLSKDTVLLTIVLRHPASNLITFGPRINDHTVMIAFDKHHDIKVLLDEMKFGQKTDQGLLEERGMSQSQETPSKKRRRVTPRKILPNSSSTTDSDARQRPEKVVASTKKRVKTPKDRIIYTDHPKRTKHVFTDVSNASDVKSEVSWLNQDSDAKKVRKPKREYVAHPNSPKKKQKKRKTVTPTKKPDLFDSILGDENRKPGRSGPHHKRTYVAVNRSRTSLDKLPPFDADQRRQDDVQLSPRTMDRMRELNDLSMEKLRCETDFDENWSQSQPSQLVKTPQILVRRESDSSGDEAGREIRNGQDDDIYIIDRTNDTEEQETSAPASGEIIETIETCSTSKTPSMKKPRKNRAPQTPLLLSTPYQDDNDILATCLDAHISPIKTPKTPRDLEQLATLPYSESDLVLDLVPPPPSDRLELEESVCEVVSEAVYDQLVSGPSSRVCVKKRGVKKHATRTDQYLTDGSFLPRQESLVEKEEEDRSSCPESQDSRKTEDGSEQNEQDLDSSAELSQDSSYKPRKLSFTPKNVPKNHVQIDAEDEDSENEQQTDEDDDDDVDVATSVGEPTSHSFDSDPNVSAKSMVECFGRQYTQKMQKRKKFLEKKAKETLQLAQHQVLEQWDQHHEVRSGFVNKFSCVLGAEIHTLETRINESKKTEAEMMEFLRAQSARLEEQRNSQLDRVRTLKGLYRTFSKRYTQIESLQAQQQQPVVAAIMKKQIGALQKAILSDMQKQDLGTMKRALHRMMFE